MITKKAPKTMEIYQELNVVEFFLCWGFHFLSNPDMKVKPNKNLNHVYVSCPPFKFWFTVYFVTWLYTDASFNASDENDSNGCLVGANTATDLYIKIACIMLTANWWVLCAHQ